MTLDALQKIASILFSSLGTFVLGYLTLTGQWREIALKEDRFCINSESYYIEAALRSERNPSEALLQRIKERCDFASLDEARQTFEAEKAGYQQLASQDIGVLPEPVKAGGNGAGIETTPAPAPDGWVILASIEAGRVQSNFVVSGSETPAVDEDKAAPPGTILAARWSGNLRHNTEPTTGPDNPSLAIIETGACVELVGEVLEKRSVIWAPVKYAPCAQGV